MSKDSAASDDSGARDRLARLRQLLVPNARTSGDGRQRSFFAISAGWMIAIAGLLAIFNGFGTLMGEASWNVLDIFVDLNRYSICAVVVMLLGAIAVVGGLLALRGGNLSLALAGAALGMVGDGIIGFWLGLAAILFLFLSSEDF